MVFYVLINKSHLLVSTVSFSKLGLAASSLSHLHIFWPLLFPVMSSPEGHCSGTFPNLWGNLQSLLETPLTEAVFQAVVGRKLSFPFNYRYTLICGYPFRALCCPQECPELIPTHLVHSFSTCLSMSL